MTFVRYSNFRIQYERHSSIGRKVVFIDGDGHHCRWRYMLTADEPAVVLSWHMRKVTVRADFVGEAQDSE